MAGKQNKNGMTNTTDQIFDALLKDPTKRRLILELLASENKQLFDDHGGQTGRERNASPSRSGQKKQHHQSPVALMRRRALEKRDRNWEREQGASTSAADSNSSSNGVELKTPQDKVPTCDLLKGVVAYVEVKKAGQDRSQGAEMVLLSMGAKIVKQFTRDVTHVVYKDGSYATFQKAKLLKVHLVGVLWLDAVKRNNRRVPESDYPPYGTESFLDPNVSAICSQLQQDYEDVVRDEARKSMAIARPNYPSGSSKDDSFKSAIDVQDLDADLEVAAITIKTKKFVQISPPELTSDDANDSDRDDSASRVVNRAKDKLPVSVIHKGANSSNKSKRNDSYYENNVIDSSPESNDSDSSESASHVVNCVNESHLSNKVPETSNKKSKRDSDQDSDIENNVSDSAGSKSFGRRTRRTLFELKDNKDDKRLNKTDQREQLADRDSKGKTRRKTINVLSNIAVVPSQELAFSDVPHSTPIPKKFKEPAKKSQQTPAKPQQTPAKNITTRKKKTPKRQKSPMSTSETSDNNSDKNEQKTKKKRRLYNPNDVVEQINNHKSPLSDEQERQARKDKLLVKENVKDNDNFLVPALVLNKKKTPKTSVQKEADSTDSELDLSFTVTPRKKNKKPTASKDESYSSSFDEQKELKKQVLGTRRSSVRLSQRSRIDYKDLSSGSVSSMSADRRSSAYFQASSQSDQRSTQRSQQSRMSGRRPSIVCTKFHRNEFNKLIRIVERLDGFVVENVVTQRTTHLVAGECKRTVNMLKAMARGCWILKHDWLLKSAEAGCWLPEEDYELTEFSPLVQKCRLQRQAFGPTFRMDVFRNCGPIFISNNTNPPTRDLKALVTLCHGQLTTTPKHALIVVGISVRLEKTVSVSEMWVLDSITFNKVKSFSNYLLKGLADSGSSGVDSPVF